MTPKCFHGNVQLSINKQDHFAVACCHSHSITSQFTLR